MATPDATPDATPRSNAASPGTAAVDVHVLDYTADRLYEAHAADIDEALNLIGGPSVTWINVDGVGNTEVLDELCALVDAHPLLREDIVSVRQRPKVEDYGNHLYVVARMLERRADGEFRTEQVSILLGPGFVFSFLEDPGDVFDPVREKLRQAKGRIRHAGADHLVYALLDAIVDDAMAHADALADAVDALEDQVFDDGRTDRMAALYAERRAVGQARRAIVPTRELLSALRRLEGHNITPATAVYLRDVEDHLQRTVEHLDGLRETLTHLVDMNLALADHKMNEVMKAFTAIAGVFLPLTFLTGLYGMNFKHMPELQSQNGYFVLLGLMGAIAALLIWWFKKKRWL